ncbi:MAG: hypothetical protein IKO68_08185 [Oscillospiraceae bacterium]|nr:hypothetical protein [Oscillospiraceae bacterium]
MKLKTFNITEYTKAIEEMLKIEGLQATNAANHEALERGMITLDMFQAGARVLAKEILNR